MFNPLRVVLTLAIIGMVMMVSPRCVVACSCAAPPSPAAALAASTAVFVGTVTSIEGYNSSDGVVSSTDPLTVTLNVSRTWKGPTRPWLIVTTVRDEGSCGYTFERGQEYVVYALGSDSTLTVNLCSRTRRFADAGDDLAALGEGMRFGETTAAYPTDAPPPVLTEGPQSSAAGLGQDVAFTSQPVLLLGMAVLGLFALLVFVRALRLLR